MENVGNDDAQSTSRREKKHSKREKYEKEIERSKRMRSSSRSEKKRSKRDKPYRHEGKIREKKKRRYPESSSSDESSSGSESSASSHRKKSKKASSTTKEVENTRLLEKLSARDETLAEREERRSRSPGLSSRKTMTTKNVSPGIEVVKRTGTKIPGVKHLKFSEVRTPGTKITCTKLSTAREIEQYDKVFAEMQQKVQECTEKEQEVMKANEKLRREKEQYNKVFSEMQQNVQESTEREQKVMKANEKLRREIEQYDKVSKIDKRKIKYYKKKLEEIVEFDVKEELEGELTGRDIESDKISPIDQLEVQAKPFLPVTPAKPPPRPLQKMTVKERSEYFDDEEHEAMFLANSIYRFEGQKCAVCNQHDSGEEADSYLVKCRECNIFVHEGCYGLNLKLGEGAAKLFLCDSCKYIEEEAKKRKGEQLEQQMDEEEYHDTKTTVIEEQKLDKFIVPSCNLCVKKGGALKKAYANHVNLKKIVKKLGSNFKKCLFGHQIWAHAMCGFWCPLTHFDNSGKFDCTMAMTSNGLGHIQKKHICALCGRCEGIKVSCAHKQCKAWGDKKPFRFHLSCALEAGLEISYNCKMSYNNFYLCCFQHSKCDFALRAKFEDLIEIERFRAGVKPTYQSNFMTPAHASRLLQFAINIMRCLGWAWRWAEWWVELGDNWEPLLDEGQNESKMSKEELKIVDSTKGSRCKDARMCRLAAFGSALRNRYYDDEEGGGKVALDRALRAVLHTQSLVGPLKENEIDFFADWLGKAYRSNSPILGFGNDKIIVSKSGACLHADDSSPKFELGNRSLPGKNPPVDGVFENDIDDVDDFLKHDPKEQSYVLGKKMCIHV